MVLSATASQMVRNCVTSVVSRVCQRYGSTGNGRPDSVTTVEDGEQGDVSLMSVAHRQKTCACCGRLLKDTDNITVEPLVDNNIRYVVTHWDCNTFVHHGKTGEHLTDTEG